MKKGNAMAWFLIVAVMLVLVALLLFGVRSVLQADTDSFGDVDETSSVSTLVKSAYTLATECFLRFNALNDGQTPFRNMHPSTLSDPKPFLQEVVDDTLLNFSVFVGREIEQEEAFPVIDLGDEVAILMIDQKFTIKVDNKQNKIHEFVSSIPTKMKQFMAERDELLIGEDLELNKLYGKDAKIYGKSGHSIIELNKEGEKFLFVR